jgi:hypothetical protein
MEHGVHATMANLDAIVSKLRTQEGR